MEKIKNKPKITGKTKLGDIVEKYPRVAEILAGKYRLHCVGCFATAFETLEEGAMAHGMNKKEIDILLEEINRIIGLGSDESAKRREK
jgi:hybrid cluster-associated redox disulfide protein